MPRWQPAWWKESRQPAFISPDSFGEFGGIKYLWGNIPPYDVLNLAKNEGENYDKDLALCFAASGDLRNVIESVISLPEGYGQTCTCVLNDKDTVVMCRNIVMLLIMMVLPAPVAVELALHVWFSARLTSDMVHSLRKIVQALVADIVAKVFDVPGGDKPGDVLFGKTWTFGTSTLSAHLYKEHWSFVLAMLKKDHNVDVTEKSHKDIMLNNSRLDFIERSLFPLPPFRRLCKYKMRQHGILLPFGCHLDEFRIPNPTLFDLETSSWMQRESTDPAVGWPVKATLGSNTKYGIPDEDLYGLLYFHIREKLQAFCKRIAGTKLNFHVYCVDAAFLPSVMNRAFKFDRVDVANVVDRGNLGLEKTLRTCGSLLNPLLKALWANPHAVLIAHFASAVDEAEEELDPQTKHQQHLSALAKVSDFIPRPDTPDPHHPTLVRSTAAQSMFRDYDLLFQRYMDQIDFDEVGWRTNLRMKAQNTVIEAWPYRFTKEAGEEGAQEAFNLQETSMSDGSERFVEWVRLK